MKNQSEIIEIQTTDAQRWNECVDLWLRVQRSDNTRKSFRYSLNQFLTQSGLTSPGAARRSDVIGWIESLKQRKLKISSIRTRVVALSSLYRYASEYLVDGQPLTGNNPAELRGLKLKVKSYSSSRALNRAEVLRFLGAIDPERQNGLRDYALLAGYLVLGRRNTEWRLAKVQDFELRGDVVFYRWSGKGKTDELIDVPVEIWKALQAYISQSGGRGMFDYVFLDRSGSHPISARRVGQMVKRYASLAGIEGNLRVHDLRHTAVLLRRLAGADVEEIRDFLGHSTLAMTQVYMHRIERRESERGEAVVRMLNLRGRNV